MLGAGEGRAGERDVEATSLSHMSRDSSRSYRAIHLYDHSFISVHSFILQESRLLQESLQGLPPSLLAPVQTIFCSPDCDLSIVPCCSQGRVQAPWHGVQALRASLCPLDSPHLLHFSKLEQYWTLNGTMEMPVGFASLLFRVSDPAYWCLYVILRLPRGALTASWAGTAAHSGRVPSSVTRRYGRLLTLTRGILSESFPSSHLNVFLWFLLGLFSLFLFDVRMIYPKAEIWDLVLRIGQTECEFWLPYSY